MAITTSSKAPSAATAQGNIQEIDKAIKSLETAAKLRPSSAATMSNLAIGYNFRKRYLEAVKVAYKAAQIEDSEPVVQNLVNSIAHAPLGMQQNNQEVKPIMEETTVLAAKHQHQPAGRDVGIRSPARAG